MKRLLLIALLGALCLPLSASMSVDGVWKAGVWATTVWADGVWLEGEGEPDPCPGCSPITDVVGQASAAAADTLLEADGFDLGVETESCSAAADNSIIRQNPAAGVEAAAGTLVDVVSSNGVACTGRSLPTSVRERVGLPNR